MISLKTDEGLNNPLTWLPDWVEHQFGPKGGLCQKLGLEYRPEQQQMAVRHAQSFLGDESLLFEAGTGVGKSLAYLIPGIMFAVETGRPLVISTHTIALQEQLQQKDLPLARTFFQTIEAGKKYRQFQTALLVGKGNYLCETRLARALQSQQELFEDEVAHDLKRVAEWAQTTQTGLRHELVPPPRPEVWDEVNADSSLCSRRSCGETGCCYRRARKLLDAAQVRIVNHSLLFALINAGASPAGERRGILFPDDVAVLDEAHTIPGIATEHFGLGVSSYALSFALKRLFNPKTGKGILSRLGSHRDCLAVADAMDAVGVFFNTVQSEWLKNRDVVRLRRPGWAEPLAQIPLKKVVDNLAYLESRTEDESKVTELKDHRMRISSMAQAIRETLDLADEHAVYWLERAGKQGRLTHLRSAPIDVAPLLNQRLFQRHTSINLTSATLALNGTLEHYREKSGSWGAAGEIVSSPFDFPNRMRILVNNRDDIITAGVKAGREPLHLDHDALANLLKTSLAHIGGGALVLFTSYADLNATRHALEPILNKLNRPLLFQGSEMSRTALTNRMKEVKNGVLLGTDSFWTGVDLPGIALTQVYITRLPFENPSHPVAEARSEHVRSSGGNPFLELTLPEALLKFRQGIGRLIRNQNDAGYVFVLDSRIVQKEYGAAFLNMLPHNHYLRFQPDCLESLLAAQPPFSL